MRNYEEKMYSLGESISGQTHAMSQAVQKTLKNFFYGDNIDILDCDHFLQLHGAEDVQLAKNTRMNGHIAKPLDMNKLNDVLENWL